MAGAAGPVGPTGAAGAKGATGATGGTGVVNSTSMANSGGTVTGPTPNSGYVFIGPTKSISILSGQEIFGSGSVPLQSFNANRTIKYGLCYQPGGSGEIKNFVGNAYQNIVVSANTSIVLSNSASLSGLASGAYTVGFCVSAVSAHTFIFDYVNAWFIVTN
jgi:hypothetical protein